MIRFRLGTFVLFAPFIFACSHSEVKPRKITPEEQKTLEVRVGEDLAKQLEPNIKIRKNEELSRYFGELATHLLEERAKETKLQDGFLQPRVFLIESKENKFRNFVFPGERIYIPTSLVREVQYENELAAMLAFELAKLQLKSVVRQVKELNGTQDISERADAGRKEEVRDADSAEAGATVSSEGVVVLGREEMTDVAKVSVDLLYGAGYDPRGMLAYLDILDRNTSRSPLSRSEIDRLRKTVREEISLKTPLRNPIVRSEEFVRYLERIKKL